MSQATSPSTGIPYGLARVCRIWNLPRSTVYWQRAKHVQEKASRRRPGPIGPCRDAELVEHIRSVISNGSFHGEGYRKVWCRLRLIGIRTSKARVMRLMREHGLQAPVRIGKPRGPRTHDGKIVTERVNEMWATDMTSAITLEGQVNIFVAVDHCCTGCVGIHASRSGSRFEALEPIRQGVREHFGAFGHDVCQGLSLRHDHGSQYMSRDFQEEVSFLGIKSSPAFVRAPEGNGCVERFIRTLKENLLWVQAFETIEDLRQALQKFKDQYNERWIIGRHGYRTPNQVRASQLEPIELAA